MGDRAAVEAFERDYAARSGTTVDELHAAGRWGAPCDCGAPACEGFQMLHAHDENDLALIRRKGLSEWVRRSAIRSKTSARRSS